MSKQLRITYTVTLAADEDCPEISQGYRVYRQEDEEGKFYSVSRFDPKQPDAPEVEIIEEWEMPSMPTLGQIEEHLNDDYCSQQEQVFARIAEG